LSGGKRDRDETVKTFDWTRQTIELVNRLQVDLSETNEQWERFKVHGGDVDYFSDSISSADIACKSNYLIPDDNSQNRLKPLLCEIGEQFQRLQTVQRTLDALSASCKDSANAVSVHNEHDLFVYTARNTVNVISSNFVYLSKAMNMLNSSFD
jgi:hypothetical protein